MHFGVVFFYYSYEDHFLIKFKLLLQREAWGPKEQFENWRGPSLGLMDVCPDRFTQGCTASWNENPGLLAPCPVPHTGQGQDP